MRHFIPVAHNYVIPATLWNAINIKVIAYTNSHTDPITGKDVMERVGGPFIIDGILTAYFETDETRHINLTSPFNHPVPRLGNEPSIEDDRGG